MGSRLTWSNLVYIKKRITVFVVQSLYWGIITYWGIIVKKLEEECFISGSRNNLIYCNQKRN